MLKIMRKKSFTRNFVLVVIIIALASYVLVSFGKAPPRAQGDTITRLGDIPLQIKDVNLAVKNLRNRFSQIDPDTLNQLAASTVINDAIMKDAAKDLGIRVSDMELRDFVIQFRKRFSKEGEFITADQWAEWVRFTYQMPVGVFEKYIRDNDLTLSQFRNLFRLAAVATEQEVRNAFIDNNQKVDLDYVTVNTSLFRQDLDLSDDHLKKIFDADKDNFKTDTLRKIKYVFMGNDLYKDNAAATDEDIQAFFDERKDRPPYFTEERVHAKHILIKTEEGKKDQALTKAKKIAAEIKAGLSFEDAVKKYSEDESNAQRGGDLGFATRDKWDPKFSEVAFSLEKDQVSDPVESSFGIHIIKVIEKRPAERKTFEDVKEQIKEQLLTRAARELTRDKAKEFQEKLEVSLDLEALAKEYGVEVVESNFFDQDPQATIDATIQKNQNVAKQVFELKTLNDFTGNIDIGRGVVIAQWVEEKEPQSLSWETDAARIKASIETSLSEEYLNQVVSKISQKAKEKPEALFSELISEFSFISDKNIKDLSSISKANPPSTLGAKDLSFETLYEAEKGTVLGPLEGKFNRQFIIAFVKNKMEPDFNKFEEEKLSLQGELKQTKGFDILTNYVFVKRQLLDPNGEKQARLQAMIAKQ